MTRALIFLRGMLEFRQAITWADSEAAREQWGGYTPLDRAYDTGRELAHRLTFRRFEE